MNLDEIPSWAWVVGGGLIVVLMIVKGSGSSSGIKTLGAGPVEIDNTLALAEQRDKASGFNIVAGVVSNLELAKQRVFQSIELERIETSGMLEAERVKSSSREKLANIQASYENARIQLERDISLGGQATQRDLARQQTKQKATGGILGVVGSVAKGIGKVLGKIF